MERYNKTMEGNLHLFRSLLFKMLFENNCAENYSISSETVLIIMERAYEI